MIKFNDKSIFVGYIKELLHTFNLPNVKVFDSSFIYEGYTCIKDDYIQEYKGEGNWKEICPYAFNQRILNYTKNLKVENNIYDSHTHAYLGEYLRFIRDYKHLDLMSMYNCFDNTIVPSLNLNWQNDSEEDFTFNTQDNYKIYAIPVKFNKNYTVAFSANTPVELVCGIYHKGIIEIESSSLLYKETYKKIPFNDFKKPFIYNKLNKEVLKLKELVQYEDELKLFIKLPINNNTSIVVLEGEFLNTNNKYLSIGKTDDNSQPKQVWKHARTIYNFADLNDLDINNLNFSSSLQLLELNSNFSYPFADRLVEYLVDNPITNIEEISDNIKRVQESLVKRRKDSEAEKTGLENYKHSGLWEDRYKAVLYNIAAEEGLLDSKFDILGYVDKDIEIKLKNSEVDIYQKE